MTILTEGNHTGDFLHSEPDARISREQVVVTGGAFEPGTVLSITAEGKYGKPDPAAGEHGVLFAKVDASTEDKPALMLMRMAAVKANHLEWPADMSDEDKASILSDMKDVQLIAR